MDIAITNSGTTFKNGDFQLVRDVPSEVAQRVYIRFRTTYGKWFLDTTMGIDWLKKVFGKRKNKIQIDYLIRQELKKESKIVDITTFTSKVVDRVYSCTFTVKVNDTLNIPITIKSSATGLVVDVS